MSDSFMYYGHVMVDIDECFARLYEMCGESRDAPLHDLMQSTSRIHLRDCLREYIEEHVGTFRARPIMDNSTLTAALCGVRFILQFYCEFPDKDELNRYKLTHPDKYQAMKGGYIHAR